MVIILEDFFAKFRKSGIKIKKNNFTVNFNSLITIFLVISFYNQLLICNFSLGEYLYFLMFLKKGGTKIELEKWGLSCYPVIVDLS